MTIAAPAESLPVLETLVLEAVKRPLEQTFEAAAKANALAICPGLGREEESKELVRRLLAEAEIPAVVAIQLLIGAYGGYFGAAMGIVMLASLALVSDQSPSPAASPIRDAVPEVTRPLPVLWDSRELPSARRGPSAGGRSLAVLAQPSQPQECDQLGAIPAAAEDVRPAHTQNRTLYLTRSCGVA